MKCSISTYYKILDAELYDFDDGYMQLNVDIDTKNIDLEEYVSMQKRALRICAMCRKKPVRSIFAYDRYCRRKRHQEDQSCNGSASDRWHSDCKYPGNYSDTSVFVLWHTEGVNITSNSHDTERGKTECKRDYHRCGYCTGCRASCIRLRQRFE